MSTDVLLLNFFSIFCAWLAKVSCESVVTPRIFTSFDSFTTSPASLKFLFAFPLDSRGSRLTTTIAVFSPVILILLSSAHCSTAFSSGCLLRSLFFSDVQIVRSSANWSNRQIGTTSFTASVASRWLGKRGGGSRGCLAVHLL